MIRLSRRQKLSLGSALVTVGICGVVVLPLIGVEPFPESWDSITSFLYGVILGVGAVLCVAGLGERESQ